MKRPAVLVLLLTFVALVVATLYVPATPWQPWNLGDPWPAGEWGYQWVWWLDEPGVTWTIEVHGRTHIKGAGLGWRTWEESVSQPGYVMFPLVAAEAGAIAVLGGLVSLVLRVRATRRRESGR